MSLIITATDFSDTGMNAVQYACQLAAAQGADVAVLHSFSIPLMFSDVPIPPTFINDTQQDAEKNMDEVLKTLRGAHPSVNISGKVFYGEITDVIEDYVAANTAPWMIVVGNSLSGENSSWPDSTLVAAFRSLKYPVLAIPANVTYKHIRNVCFAFDNKRNNDDKPFLQLATMTQALKAQLHVLYAHTGSAPGEIDNVVKDLLHTAHPQYHVVPGNIDSTIESFVNVSNADMLVMIPRRHSFFEGLFHHSHTKAVAHQSRIPILALHESE